MSYSQQSKMQSHNNNNNIKLDPRDQNLFLTQNLELYIPRANLRTTEQQVRDHFFSCNIGTVEHCDLVVTKDKETKQPQFASVFLKLVTWSPFSGACKEFAENGSIKLHLSRTSSEFWVILPNKNPLPRTHVNTSQLAASTEKLFEQTEKINEKAEKFQDEMRAEMAEMRQMMKLQQEKIEDLEFQLKRVDLQKYDATANLSYENVRQQNHIDRLNDYIFGSRNGREIDLMLDQIECDRAQADIEAEEEAEELARAEELALQDAQLEQTKQNDLRCIEWDEDDMKDFSAGLGNMKDCSQSKLNRSAPLDDDCIFSNLVKRRSPPIQIQVNSEAEAKSLSLPDIVSKHPQRAIVSRDFCGNL